MPLHLKGVEKQSMTSDVNKYHIVPLWTGFYFSDTWGCQAAAVHRSGNLRSLPWSLWPEFLRRQWKKKNCQVRLAPFPWKKTHLDFRMPSTKSSAPWGFWVGSWEESVWSPCLVTLAASGHCWGADGCSQLREHLNYSSAVVNANCPLSI